MLTGVSIFVALAGLWFGLMQYRLAQRWKRMEYAASIIDQINTDEDLKLALTFLDWRERDIVIPGRFGPTEEFFSFRHSHARMAEAFKLENREISADTGMVDLKAEYLKTEYIIYVEIFDRFFDYLEQVNQCMNMGLIKRDDLERLNYWADRIFRMRYDSKPIFKDYLQYFGYDGVLSFVTSEHSTKPYEALKESIQIQRKIGASDTHLIKPVGDGRERSGRQRPGMKRSKFIPT